MTYVNVLNALKMEKYSENDLVFSNNNGNTEKVVINRWSTIETLSVEQISTDFDICYDILSPILRLGGLLS